jgi:uncharacterized membrane protein YqaE (UPF0057 family)
MYLLAIFLPPLAVLIKKGFLAALLNLFLCLLGFFPGVIHAFIVVAEANADKRTEKIEKKFDELIHTQRNDELKEVNTKQERISKEKKESWLKRALTPNNIAWFFSIMFIISALGSLTEFKYLETLLFLATGLMISPATWRILKEKSDDQTRNILKVVLVVLVIISFSVIANDDEIKSEPSAQEKISVTATPVPTEQPIAQEDKKESDAPSPEPISPIEKSKNDIENTVKSELKGKNNLGNEKYRSLNIRELTEGLSVDIEFNASDNMTHNLRRKGMESQMSKLLKALYTSEAGENIKEIAVTAYFPLTDQYGNEKETIVYTAILDEAEAKKINWDFDRASLELQIIPSVWEVIVLHPAIK